MSAIKPIHTPCKSCVFAVYEDKTQIGCHLNYIDKYRSKDIEILDVYDQDKEFYVINDKKCIGYRENSWFEKRNLTHLSISEKVAKFNKNNFLHYLMIIDLKNFNDDSIDQLITELASLTIPPRKIVFVRYNSNKNHPYEKIQNILEKSNLKCKWRLQTMLEDTDNAHVLYETMNSNRKYRFVLSIKEPTTNINQIVSLANKTVYDDLGIFLVMRNESKSAILFSAPNFRQMLFIENKDLLDANEHHIVV